MARPRKFDESQVLAAVMNAFWRHGYTATTTRSLEEISGVGIRSLANTFGDKESLYTKALACYREAAAESIAVAFNPPSVAAIITYFESLSAPIDPTHPLNSGCLMVNTVTELEEPPDQIAQGDRTVLRTLARHVPTSTRQRQHLRLPSPVRIPPRQLLGRTRPDPSRR